MKAYIWKYALTKGIIEANGELYQPDNSSVVYFSSKGLGVYNLYREYSLTREEAVREAEQLRDRKLKSIEKQVKKLKELKF